MAIGPDEKLPPSLQHRGRVGERASCGEKGEDLPPSSSGTRSGHLQVSVPRFG